MENTFEVVSKALMISDPCYVKGTWCQFELNNVMNGIWEYEIVTKDMGDWGNRAVKLIARHKEYFAQRNIPVEKFIINELGVDSGQLGIFDYDHYRRDSQFKEGSMPIHDYGDAEEDGRKFYGFCCDLTLEETHGGVIPYGCVSRTGFGDGCYEGQGFKDVAGKVVCVEVTFIEDELEENDGEY